MLGKFIFMSFVILASGCKESSVSSVSDASIDPEANRKGACVFYEKETKKVQQTCASGQDQAGCDESFKVYYENVAPGKYERELLLGTDCTDGRLKVAERLANIGSDTDVKGACVFYEKETKKVQANCAAGQNQAGCDESFKIYYENVAPGKFERELVLKTDCTDARLKVAERLSKDSSSNAIVGNSKCVCGGFVQKKAKQRYCLVARKLENSKWQAVAQLRLEADCKTQCDASTGSAAAALASAACKE